ncbi:hypothetical protein Pfo_027087 [Paulownia fortunei]|nr:hypothetical protein Pfo_027087 [Paulownia fortunei]
MKISARLTNNGAAYCFIFVTIFCPLSKAVLEEWLRTGLTVVKGQISTVCGHSQVTGMVLHRRNQAVSQLGSDQ